MSEFVSYCLSDHILTSSASLDIINIKLARALYIIKLLYKCGASIIIATDAILLIVRWVFPPLHALLYTRTVLLYNRSYVDKLWRHVVSR